MFFLQSGFFFCKTKSDTKYFVETHTLKRKIAPLHLCEFTVCQRILDAATLHGDNNVIQAESQVSTETDRPVITPTDKSDNGKYGFFFSNTDINKPFRQ